MHETVDDMFEEESRVIRSDKPEYNIALGGKSGSFDYLNETGRNHRHDNRSGSLQNLEHGRQIGRRWVKEMATPDEIHAWRSAIGHGVRAHQAVHGNPFCGKHHTDDTKQKIGEKTSIAQAGERNSQFGTRWITNGTEVRKAPVGEHLPSGWVYGKVLQQDKRTRQHQRIGMRMHTDLKSLRVPVGMCNACASEQDARDWYDRLTSSSAKSIREFVRDSDYGKSHVSFIKMLKKYIPEFQPEHGKKFMLV